MKKEDCKSKEQLILEMAEQEFFTKGYDGARTTSIARKAGVTHAMLHYYFRTKEQLFEQIINKSIASLGETMRAAIGNPDMPIIERLRDAIATHFDLILANPLLPRFILNEVIVRPERYKHIIERLKNLSEALFANLQQDVDAAVKRNEIEHINVQMLFISIISLNIFPFAIYDFAIPILGNSIADKEKFLAERKAENIETIMKRIIKK